MSSTFGNLDLNDERVPKASFSAIDFALREARDPAELMNLLHACQVHGFCYLNFDNSETTKSIPMDIKMQTTRHKDQRPEKKRLRIVEHLMLSRWDFVLGNSTIAPAVQAERDLFQAYLDRCNYVVSVMLGALFDVLEIPAGKRFDRGHDAQSRATSGFRMNMDCRSLLLKPINGSSSSPGDRHAVINPAPTPRHTATRFQFSPLNSALHIFQVNPPTKPPQRNSVGLPPHPSTAMTDADPICVQLLITLSIVLKIAALPRIFHGKYYLQSSLLTFIAWVPSKAATTKIPDDQETISTVRNHNITVGWIFALHVACSGIPDLIEGLRCCIPPEPHSPPGFDQGVIAPFDD
ncbi:hypothetical protein DFH09DRAFT_1367069 [Mycena vulgaris]|nr:hypothetical protein DFH09DRAFT_1367069 [Mycena vulgaris]